LNDSGELSRSANSDHPSGKGSLVDLNTGTLRRNHVLIQQAPGVELFIGLGPIAGCALDFAFADEADPLFAQSEAIDDALGWMEIGKAQAPILRALAESDEPHLRRLALLEAMLAKVDVDDPHPRWPAGTPGGVGGQFRPNDTSEAARETTQQELRRLEARRVFRIAAVAVLRLLATGALNLIPGAGEVADVEELMELGRTAIELGNAAHEVNAAIDRVPITRHFLHSTLSRKFARRWKPC
jgi:hypothetical protein